MRSQRLELAHSFWSSHSTVHQTLGQRSGLNLQPTVALLACRKVHSGLGTQPQHILKRRDRHVRNRSQRRSNKIPVNLAPVAVQILQAVFALLFDLRDVPSRADTRFTVEPADDCVAVMRARVHGRVANVVVRQVLVVRRAPERELQHVHARQTQVVAKGFYIGVMTPRSSAIIERSPILLESSEKLTSRNRNHFPCSAVLSQTYFPAGANPLK